MALVDLLKSALGRLRPQSSSSTDRGSGKRGLANIEHVVVLMLENRSFDSMLGRLYPDRPDFDGLTRKECNPGPDGKPVFVNNTPGYDPIALSNPHDDPGELFSDITEQIFGVADPAPDAVPTMSGFVSNFVRQRDLHPLRRYDPASVMNYYTPDQVPVLSTLARQFAVCDRWFASAPCQTWPNRFFLNTGTAAGYENNNPPNFPYEMPTIFDRFNDKGMGRSWKIYRHDTPQSLSLAKMWQFAGRLHAFRDFEIDAEMGRLPNYSLIEPRYFASLLGGFPNDQHPPHNITLGEQLIANVYNALRKGPGWTKTLLIVTYDEHGGCYDHVPPPRAVAPDYREGQRFKFDRYGVRVPAVIVSPYIKPGTVLRPPGDTPFDHTSVLATLRKRFDLGAPFTPREAAAPDLECALTLSKPDNLGPAHIKALHFIPKPSELIEMINAPLNDLQKTLHDMTQILPPPGTSVDEHVGRLRTSKGQHVFASKQTVKEACEQNERALEAYGSRRTTET